MKKLLYMLPLALVVISCAHKKSKPMEASNRLPGGPVLTSDEAQRLLNNKEGLSDTVLLTHKWKDLDSSVYRRFPLRSEIARWKEEFENANKKDSAWRFEVMYYRDKDHYMAVHDFIEIWHASDSGTDNDDRAEWRLLQWDPSIDSIPKKGYARIHHIYEQIEGIMSYQAGSQWDMTFYGWLWTDFLEFYNRILRREIIARASEKTVTALKKEAKAADKLHDLQSEAFQVIQGDPEWSGSSFPYRCGMFGKECLEIEVKANSYLLMALMLWTPDFGESSTITSRDVLKEYDRFAKVLDTEYEDPEVNLTGWKARQRDVLAREKKAWTAWMAARERVSALLSGIDKIAFDTATSVIRREKLVLLKNRYNLDDGFCDERVAGCLVDKNCTDEEILVHNLEELLNNE